MPETQMIRSCSIWRALEVIGDFPTLLILESHWLGARKFNEISKATGVLKTVISDRLKKLIDAECFSKSLYSESPKRYEYGPTDKFKDLYKTALSMLYWERQWGETDSKIKVDLIHKKCGMITFPTPVCGHCLDVIDARGMEWREGPGVGEMPATYSRRRRRSANARKNNSTTLFDTVSKIIGDRPSSLIIRSIFTGINRFQEIQEDAGLATNVLTDRLNELQAADIIYRKPNPNQSRRATYKMTEKGRDIYPIIIMIMEWGDKWYASPEGAPVVISHKSCGAHLEPKVICSACKDFVEIGELEYKVHDSPESIQSES